MSIIHRATGVIMVLAIPILLYAFAVSLENPENFATISAWFRTVPGYILLFLCLWGLLHHLLAGVRYLLIDIELGIDKPAYRMTAWAVLVFAPILSLFFLGVLA